MKNYFFTDDARVETFKKILIIEFLAPAITIPILVDASIKTHHILSEGFISGMAIVCLVYFAVVAPYFTFTFLYMRQTGMLMKK